VLAESALLAGAGGALGLIFGAVGARLLPLVAPANVPRLAESAVDTRVLVFAGTITLLCTLVVGIGPALGLARRLPGSPSGARLIGDRRGGGVRRALVVAQVAASLALMVCAGLLAGSVNRLGDVDTGFADDDVLTFAISLPGARYGWPIETDAFFRRLEEHVRALPGVSAAAVVWPLPFDGRRWDGSFTGGVIAEEDRLLVRYELVTPTFFETLDIPLRGAAFGADDPKRAVIVSRSLADRAWPGEDPMGRTLRALPWGQDTVTFRVIGVAGDVRFVSLQERPDDVVYFDSRGYAWTDWEVNFVVRARGDLSRLAEGIRTEVARMDPEIPVASIRPLADLVRAGTATERFARTVFMIFAGFAGLLVVIGLYGVVSYGVRLRRREFGIRMALGLEKGGVLRLVLTQGFGLAFAGVILGLAGAVAAAGALRAWLFGLTTHEPAVYLSAAFGMLAIALVATLIPAWAATRLDPANVLRSE
jgi:predicted permease